MSQDSVDFETLLRSSLDALKKQVVSENGDWTVKGFIDVYKRIYTISLDTKVLSKVLELLMYPVLAKLAADHKYTIKPARQQNQYPDITCISQNGKKYAIDIKSTYRKRPDKEKRERVNGMTLGTYAGYFRDRTSDSISTYPYDDYSQHLVLGVVYSQVKGIDERTIYSVDTLVDIPSVAKNFDFFVQEKYKIASDAVGAGNTKNMGSTKFLERMLNGSGIFAELGIDVFDDYWTHYRNKETARADGLVKQPYKNLIEYREHIKRGKAILDVSETAIVSEEVELEEEGESVDVEGDEE